MNNRRSHLTVALVAALIVSSCGEGVIITEVGGNGSVAGASNVTTSEVAGDRISGNEDGGSEPDDFTETTEIIDEDAIGCVGITGNPSSLLGFLSTTAVTTTTLPPEPAWPITDLIVADAGYTGLLGVGDSVWIYDARTRSICVVDSNSRDVIAIVASGTVTSQLVEAGGFVWFANTANRSVNAISIATYEVTDAISVGDRPRFLLEVDGSLWVTNSNTNTVSVIDLETRQVVDTITVGRAPDFLLEVNDEVWVANFSENYVSIIDTSIREVIDTIAVDEHLSELMRVEETVWAMNLDSINVVDIVTRKIVATPVRGSMPDNLLVVDGAVWGSSLGDGAIGIFNGLSGVGSISIENNISDDVGAYALLQVDDDVWATFNRGSQSDGSVLIIDIATRRVTDVVAVSPMPLFLVRTDSAVWVLSIESGAVSVIDIDLRADG